MWSLKAYNSHRFSDINDWAQFTFTFLYLHNALYITYDCWTQMLLAHMLYFYPGYDSVTWWWRRQRIKKYDRSPLATKSHVRMRCLAFRLYAWHASFIDLPWALSLRYITQQWRMHSHDRTRWPKSSSREHNKVTVQLQVGVCPDMTLNAAGI